MGLKIHDFCAVRIRCLVIVEIICLIFFAAGCTGSYLETGSSAAEREVRAL